MPAFKPCNESLLHYVHPPHHKEVISVQLLPHSDIYAVATFECAQGFGAVQFLTMKNSSNKMYLSYNQQE